MKTLQNLLITFLITLTCTSLIAAHPVPGKQWQRFVKAEDAGFSSEKLALAKEYYQSLPSSGVMVIYKGVVLVDWGQTQRRYRLHSVRKSLMSAMFGIYLDQGIIDREKTLAALGIDDEPKLTDEEKTARIVDLLSARSGIYRTAAYEGSAAKPPRGSHKPGSNWCYNNWDFNTLLTIFEQETGKKFFEDFTEQIAKPIGMQDYHISHGYYHFEPDKSIHPAYPFRMSARDMARLGLLYLNKGLWGQKRILSEAYVKESTAHISDADTTGGYGYMWWLYDREPFKSLQMYSALGLGGHSIDVIPGADLVLVNRVDTYAGKTMLNEQRYRLIKMILDAKEGDAVAHPKLAKLEDTKPEFTFKELNGTQRKIYIQEIPYGNDFTVSITEDAEQLWIDFGEGPIRLLQLEKDHFLIEDHNEHVFFEDRDGKKQAVIADLLFGKANRLLHEGGDQEQVKYLLEKARKYFPKDMRTYSLNGNHNMHKAEVLMDKAISSYKQIEAVDPSQSLDRSELAWRMVSLMAKVDPPNLSEKDLTRYVGQYETRNISIKDGSLVYQREGGSAFKLIALTESIFGLEGIDYFRLRFVTSPDGKINKIIGMHDNGIRDESKRIERSQ